jgi:hypothetical protein
MGMHNMQHGISKEIEMAKDYSVQEMEATRIARWGKVEPYGETFIESRLPGFEKRLYKIINRGVLENKGVQPAIKGSHRFGVTLIEVPVGMGANWHPDVLRAAEGTGLAYDNTGYLAESVS